MARLDTRELGEIADESAATFTFEVDEGWEATSDDAAVTMVEKELVEEAGPAFNDKRFEESWDIRGHLVVKEETP